MYRDVFCLLPFQIDDDSLAVAAYIQTRNILDDVDDAGRYRIVFRGLVASAASVRVVDPMTDQPVAAEVTQVGVEVAVTLTLTDTPRWILLDGKPGQ